ncbi:hypothetical protein LUZ60_008631 [Juncus effusus]|nr:hypothetical protein LUZ60_008631 [Juncus effusus]
MSGMQLDGAHSASVTGDTSTLIPLKLSLSDLVPPAPNHRQSSVDWLPDFGGASWIAHGAGPLLVISHLSSQAESSAPFFRQVIELPDAVHAVSWCPSVPCQGEIAVAAGNSICLYTPVSDQTNPGSLSWKRTESIAQESFKIESITWSGSGDALLAAGSDVILRIRNKPSWQVAWRSTPQLPQNFISATHFAHGPVATACLSHVNKFGDKHNNVLVYLTDRNFGLRIIELAHPHGVSMIQWRPHLQKGPSSLKREVLLTCSVDGTARLWSECSNINTKSKGMHDNHNKNKSFHVIAVIEINSCLNGSLGMNIDLKWAVEFDSSGVVTKDEKGSYSLSGSDDELDQVGKCEWLVASGPGSSVSFWAVHCLDDVSPVRFPRATLWKKHLNINNNSNNINTDELLKSEEGSPILLKPIISRNCLSAPPVTCSLVQLFPNNEVQHCILHSPESGDDETERYLSRISFGVMNQDGHKSSIKQISFHPYNSDTELSVSLDSDGVLIFWSLSAFSNSYFNLHKPLNPVWNLLGKIDLRKSEYSCLTWVPSVQGQNRFLLLGSERQIDCFVVRIPGESERGNFGFENIFAIPIGDFSEGKGAPDQIFTIILDSSSDESILNDSFLILCAWKNTFQILSWKITLHVKTQNNDEGNNKVCFDGKLYNVTVDPGSPKVFPNSENHEKTCFFMNPPNNSMFSIKDSKIYFPSFHMVTGYSDGNINLWKINKISESWELIGSLISHKGPINSVSFSNCGTKIATCSSIGGNSTIHIWEPVCLPGGTGGVFQLEQVINLKSPVNHLNWVSLGNGQLLLGVSFANELRIYCQKRPESNFVISEGLRETNNCSFWDCIAVSDSYYEIKDFLWGPNLSPVLVHDKHLSVLSNWLIKSSYENSTSTRGIYGNLPFVGDFCNLVDLSDRLGGPLPVYHPTALLQYLYSGKWKLVQAILQHLIQSIKTGGPSKEIPEMQLSDYFTENAPTKSSNINTGLQWGMNSQFSSNSNTFDFMGGINGNNSNSTTSQSDITELKNTLDKYPNISELEKKQIIAIADVLSEISDPSRSSPYKTLDESGRKFWVSVQFQRRYSKERICVDSSLIARAFQSECKDDLLNSTLSSDPTWLDMRDLGVGFWYNDATQLRSKMEKLARVQYLRKKDPKECALLYIALNRIQVLAGLFKISRDEKDKPLFAFLSRNFQEEKNKAAALKNAYVLMGKHQLELAVAFFLLGGDVSSAVSICAKNHGDGQLALVLCQLIQGSAGPLEKELILNVLLPDAVEKRDAWLSSLFEWKLGNYAKSVKRLFENNEGIGGVNRACYDPQIGQYCVVLASKNGFKNSVGETAAIKFSKFCAFLSANALNRYGLPIEALESSIYSKEHNILALNSKDDNEFYRLINPSCDLASNWISGEMNNHIFSNYKLIMASKYLSKFLNDHLPFSLCHLLHNGETDDKMSDNQLEELSRDLKTALDLFEKKFLLNPVDLIETISLFVSSKGLSFLKYLLFKNESSSTSNLQWSIQIPAPCPLIIFKAFQEIFRFITRFVVSHGFIQSALDLDTPPNKDDLSVKLYLKSLRTLLTILKPLLNNATSAMFDLIEYFAEFAFAWLIKDARGLIILINPILHPNNLERSDFSTSINGLKDALNKKMNKESEEKLGFIPNENNNSASNSVSMFSTEDKWIFISACLWIHLSDFAKKIHLENLTETDKQFAQLLINSLDSLRSLLIKQVAWFINQKLSKGSDSNAIVWLEKNCSASQNNNEQIDWLNVPIKGDEESLINLLYEICVRPKDLCDGFVNEKINRFLCKSKNPSASWKDINVDNISETNANSETKTYFHNPKELLKRPGELLEAICINSINHHQFAAASNRKGLVFFTQTGPHKKDNPHYMWSESDWPVNGWAGSESTPIPTCVSPGVGLGLGGATIGLTGGGSFGIPGYAAISSLSWDPEPDLPLDPPGTISTVHSCALSTHPLLPLFLAGSTNTHVYLWEFGKETAVATYGVLPAANVPPPYKLASISAVRFGMYGHRFASCASDGTVSSWMLEVGGRSNVQPVDSSLCFNNHASDVVYVSGSGSVVAAAGYSTNNVNVVVWDTLAPPATCQASLLCHEGGARSVEVFDKEMGSGSISPLIISGGKNGDIGLHDFRFLASGKTRRNKHTSDNSSGMIWYIPKAHLGSITRIASIPNTSMFLTGSKDGDVKLWDANKQHMIFHWPKLHDRHTFFQPNSRGFGGVVRAAVTDIQVMSHGFVTCGGDGSVKQILLK